MNLQLLSEIPNQFEAYVDEKLKTQLHSLNPLISEKSKFDEPMDTYMKRKDDTFQPSLEIPPIPRGAGPSIIGNPISELGIFPNEMTFVWSRTLEHAIVR